MTDEAAQVGHDEEVAHVDLLGIDGGGLVEPIRGQSLLSLRSQQVLLTLFSSISTTIAGSVIQLRE